MTDENPMSITDALLRLQAAQVASKANWHDSVERLLGNLDDRDIFTLKEIFRKVCIIANETSAKTAFARVAYYQGRLDSVLSERGLCFDCGEDHSKSVDACITDLLDEDAGDSLP